MTYKIKPYQALPCELEVFTINGIKADKEDFGTSGDYPDPWDDSDYGEDIERWGCKNYIFEKAHTINPKVLRKYNIDEDEWDEIATELECKLHVGDCGWCV